MLATQRSHDVGVEALAAGVASLALPLTVGSKSWSRQRSRAGDGFQAKHGVDNSSRRTRKVRLTPNDLGRDAELDPNQRGPKRTSDPNRPRPQDAQRQDRIWPRPTPVSGTAPTNPTYIRTPTDPNLLPSPTDSPGTNGPDRPQRFAHGMHHPDRPQDRSPDRARPTKTILDDTGRHRPTQTNPDRNRPIQTHQSPRPTVPEPEPEPEPEPHSKSKPEPKPRPKPKPKNQLIDPSASDSYLLTMKRGPQPSTAQDSDSGDDSPDESTRKVRRLDGASTGSVQPKEGQDSKGRFGQPKPDLSGQRRLGVIRKAPGGSPVPEADSGRWVRVGPGPELRSDGWETAIPCTADSFKLPPVFLSYDANQIDLWLKKYILPAQIIGLDTEWRPVGMMGGSGAVALVQLSTPYAVVLVPVIHLPHLPTLDLIYSSKKMIKCGVAILGDEKQLKGDSEMEYQVIKRGVALLGDEKQLKGDSEMQVSSLLDISKSAKDAEIFGDKKAPMGLGGLVLELGGPDMLKPKNVTCSNWEARNLSDKQIEYAALDAYASGWVLSRTWQELQDKQGPPASLDIMAWAFRDGAQQLTEEKARLALLAKMHDAVHRVLGNNPKGMTCADAGVERCLTKSMKKGLVQKKDADNGTWTTRVKKPMRRTPGQPEQQQGQKPQQAIAGSNGGGGRTTKTRADGATAGSKATTGDV
eukprot:gene14858-20919_t